MPTLIEIANELAVSFVQTPNKRHAANHIIIEINSLKYRHSKKPIEYNVKAAIIHIIKWITRSIKRGNFIFQNRTLYFKKTQHE